MRKAHTVGSQGTAAAPITAAASAPSGTEGIAVPRLAIGGNEVTADALVAYLRLGTGADTTEVDVTVWDKVGALWASGTSHTLKFTGDTVSGAKMTIPLDGTEERVFVQVTAIDGATEGVYFEMWTSEHSEAIT